MIMECLRGAVSISHFFLRERIRVGDVVVDATCGNGHDTLFLAKLVGADGKVWAFDVQKEALVNTRRLLADAGCLDRVEIVAAGHEHITEFVGVPLRAVVFNLGYLPGSDKNLTTRPEETLAAIEQATRLLLPGGVVVICVYTGHPGGAEEGKAVERWAAALPCKAYNAWVCRQPNQAPTAPHLVLVEKV